jgi:hypothetical protein
MLFEKYKMHIATTNQVREIFGLGHPKVWDSESAFQHLQTLGMADSKRTAERRIQELKLLPDELTDQSRVSIPIYLLTRCEYLLLETVTTSGYKEIFPRVTQS